MLYFVVCIFLCCVVSPPLIVWTCFYFPDEFIPIYTCPNTVFLVNSLSLHVVLYFTYDVCVLVTSYGMFSFCRAQFCIQFYLVSIY